MEHSAPQVRHARLSMIHGRCTYTAVDVVLGDISPSTEPWRIVTSNVAARSISGSARLHGTCRHIFFLNDIDRSVLHGVAVKLIDLLICAARDFS